MPITDTQLKLITEEAERLYPEGFPKKFPIPGRGSIMAYNEAKKQSHIKCATQYQEKLNLEREKAKVLVEGLKKLCSEENRPHMISIAFNTIDTYNKTINNG